MGRDKHRSDTARDAAGPSSPNADATGEFHVRSQVLLSPRGHARRSAAPARYSTRAQFAATSRDTNSVQRTRPVQLARQSGGSQSPQGEFGVVGADQRDLVGHLQARLAGRRRESVARGDPRERIRRPAARAPGAWLLEAVLAAIFRLVDSHGPTGKLFGCFAVGALDRVRSQATPSPRGHARRSGGSPCPDGGR
jgi:hypothetical protein